MRTRMEMKNMPTSYEVIMVDGDFEKRLGFSSRKTKAALLSFARQNSREIIDRCNDKDGEPAYSKSLGWSFDNVSVRFSGRTERQLTEI